jgi:hypothetical protein
MGVCQLKSYLVKLKKMQFNVARVFSQIALGFPASLTLLHFNESFIAALIKV